ncbi:hypothetical protein BKA81DRAFT_196313 [Phyllosticta paracitricarpa]|uniref:Uncharacterized protein n=1 Tax=Phyllosticta citricarpa TaxID=55181 RepID=A0ABR1MKY2_9PEZI
MPSRHPQSHYVIPVSASFSALALRLSLLRCPPLDARQQPPLHPSRTADPASPSRRHQRRVRRPSSVLNPPYASLCHCPASFTALLDWQEAVSSAATQAGQQKALLPASSNANRRSTGTNPTRRGMPDAQTSIHGDCVNSSRLPPCSSLPISD